MSLLGNSTDPKDASTTVPGMKEVALRRLELQSSNKRKK
jgi:hypothetical protein